MQIKRPLQNPENKMPSATVPDQYLSIYTLPTPLLSHRTSPVMVGFLYAVSLFSFQTLYIVSNSKFFIPNVDFYQRLSVSKDYFKRSTALENPSFPCNQLELAENRDFKTNRRSCIYLWFNKHKNVNKPPSPKEKIGLHKNITADKTKRST